MATTTLTPNDLHYVVSRIPSDVRNVVTEKHLFIAGGFIRAAIAGEQASDVDIFGADADVMSNAANALVLARGGTGNEGGHVEGTPMVRSGATDNAVTVVTVGRAPVQFIIRWLFEEPEALLAHFDFTVARVIIWRDTDGKWQSLCDPAFYADLAARRLVYTSPPDADAGGSLLRMVKMLRRGYNIHTGSLGKLVAAVVAKIDPKKVDITNTEVVEAIVIGVLREVDPLSIVDGVEMPDTTPAE